MCTCKHYTKTGFSCRLAGWLEERRKRQQTFTSGQIEMAIRALKPVCRRQIEQHS